MKNKRLLFDLISTVAGCSVLIAVDFLIKKWAYSSLYPAHNGHLDFIDGIIGFEYAENTGAAWSILSDKPWIFISLSILVVAFIIAYIFFGKRTNLMLRISLLLLLSGGIGNLIDRLFRTGSYFGNRNGYVVDMFNFEFMNFPIFNFADVCVCVGAGLFILYMLIFEMKDEKAVKVNE